MKVFCKYDGQFDDFLKNVVKYVIDVLGNELCIDDLEEIELIDKKELSIETDGRTLANGKKIILTSRLYTQLPEYDISKLENSVDFKLIVTTLYHELGHVSDMKTMPNIYAATQNSNNEKQMLSSYFWVEYLAEKRSTSIGLVDYSNYCNNFVKRQWNAYKLNFETYSEDNFFYLCKTLSYYMARTIKSNTRKTYNAKMVNSLLNEFVIAIGQELIYLEHKLPFDNVETLDNLCGILHKYYLKFKTQYAI